MWILRDETCNNSKIVYIYTNCLNSICSNSEKHNTHKSRAKMNSQVIYFLLIATTSDVITPSLCYSSRGSCHSTSAIMIYMSVTLHVIKQRRTTFHSLHDCLFVIPSLVNETKVCPFQSSCGAMEVTFYRYNTVLD